MPDTGVVAVQERTLLILDVDETLLHSTESKLARACDFQVGPYSVYLRPHLHNFLASCSRHFDVAIWSSSDEGYLDRVLAKTFRNCQLDLKLVWSRSRCVQRFDPEYQSYYFVKDLRKLKRLGYDLARVLIVDDTPAKVERNYGNAIYVSAFEGDETDDELLLLSRYLLRFKDVADVRRTEKRSWRRLVQSEEAT